MDGSEITSFNIAKNLPNLTAFKSPDENHFAITPPNQSPANVYRSDDCNEIIAKELALSLSEIKNNDRSPEDSERYQLVSQSSIEIEICDEDKKQPEPEPVGEVSKTFNVFLFILAYFNFFNNFYTFKFTGMDHLRCTFWCSTFS